MDERRAATDLEALHTKALQLKELYDRLNLKQRGRVWSAEEYVLGFIGDVGDLAKVVLSQEGARDPSTTWPSLELFGS